MYVCFIRYLFSFLLLFIVISEVNSYDFKFKILITLINIAISIIFFYLSIFKDTEENQYVTVNNKIRTNFNILNSLSTINLLNEQG